MNEKDLLKNWNDNQFQMVEDAISSYYQTPISEISEILGLALYFIKCICCALDM